MSGLIVCSDDRQQGRGVPGMPLDMVGGVHKRMGKSLPLVERLPGQFTVTGYSPFMICGVFHSGDPMSFLTLRFDSRTNGPLPVLCRAVADAAGMAEFGLRDERAATAEELLCPPLALSVASLDIWFSGRPWVKGDGTIVLLVRKFGFVREGDGDE